MTEHEQRERERSARPALERQHRVRRVAGEERARSLGRERALGNGACRAESGAQRPARNARHRAPGVGDTAHADRAGTARAAPAPRTASSARSAPMRLRYASASEPSPAAVSSTLRTSSAASSSSNGCATQAGDSSHSTSSSSSRNAVDDRASGWIAEQTSCRKPGSVSSSVRMPPPIRSDASCTTTSQPCPRERDGGREAVRPRADDDGLTRQGSRAHARCRAEVHAAPTLRCSTRHAA